MAESVLDVAQIKKLLPHRPPMLLVERLTEKHEAGREHPWAVSDAPADYVAGQLRAIVGVEVLIKRIEAKAKFSQNRSAADVDGVVAGLSRDGFDEHAQAVRQAREKRQSTR